MTWQYLYSVLRITYGWDMGPSWIQVTWTCLGIFLLPHIGKTPIWPNIYYISKYFHWLVFTHIHVYYSRLILLGAMRGW